VYFIRGYIIFNSNLSIYFSAQHKAEMAINDTLTESAENDEIEYTDNDDYHYITYIYKNGYLWELDGLKKQPVKMCECNQDNWLESAKPHLTERMNRS
jgi:ubiquitin carboxyl-terminal hydrolase L5